MCHTTISGLLVNLKSIVEVTYMIHQYYDKGELLFLGTWVDFTIM